MGQYGIELEPWARKNIGDAYLNQIAFPTAEDVYKTIQTDNLTLKRKIYMQLFSLCLNKEKQT